MDESSELTNQLLRRAQIAEAGYDITPDGRSIVQRPDYVSAKQAQAKKDMAETDILEMRRNRMRNAQQPLGGQASPLGGVSALGVPAGYTSFIDPNTGDEKIVADRNQPTPLNDLQKVTLQEKMKKAADEKLASSNKEEMLTDNAKTMLRAVGEVKKGKKYFGPLGGLPTIAAPSTLAGEYGPRKNWETNVQQLLSERVVGLMNEMKQASKTGATGFGQLNRSELQLLKDASNALKRDLLPKDAMRYLGEIEKMYQKVLAKKQGGVVSNQTENEDPLGVL